MFGRGKTAKTTNGPSRKSDRLPVALQHALRDVGRAAKFNVQYAGDNVIFGRKLLPYVMLVPGSTMNVESIGEDTSKVTMTRLATLGVYALAAKKTTGTRVVALEVVSADGSQYFAVEVPKEAEAAAHRLATQWNAYARAAAA